MSVLQGETELLGVRGQPWAGLQNGCTKKGPQITPRLRLSPAGTRLVLRVTRSRAERGGPAPRSASSRGSWPGWSAPSRPRHRRPVLGAGAELGGCQPLLPGLSPPSGAWALTSSQGHCFPDQGHPLEPGASPSLLPAQTCWERAPAAGEGGCRSGRLAALPRKPGLTPSVSNTKNTPAKSRPQPLPRTHGVPSSGRGDSLLPSLWEVP